MRKIFFALLVLSLFIFGSTGLVAQNLQALALDTEIRTAKLENGLTYYIQHNKELAGRANFSLVRNVGTLFENESQRGFTDFLLQMAFQETKNFPKNSISNYFESMGLRLGRDVRAYASPEELVFSVSDLVTAHPGAVDTTLLLLHDWLAYIQLDDSKVEAARAAVWEDRLFNESSSSRLQKKLNRLKFPGTRYAKYFSPCDLTSSLSFYPQALRDFYRTVTAPGWHAVVVVGDVDVDVIEKKIQQIFNSIPKTWGSSFEDIVHANEVPIVALVADPEACVSTLSVDFKQDCMIPDLKSTVNGYLVRTINELIAMMLNNRFREAVQDSTAPFVASSANYGALLKSKDALSLSVISREGFELKSLDALLAETEKIKRFGFLASELDRVKTDFFSSIEIQYNEGNKRKNSDLLRACFNNFLYSDPLPGVGWEYSSLQSILPQINVEMVNQIAASYITDKNVIISLSAPAKPSLRLPSKEELMESFRRAKELEFMPPQESTAKSLTLLSPPKIGKIKKEKETGALGISEWVLSNGIKLVFKPTQFKNDEILMKAFSQGGLSLIENVDDLPSAIFSTKLINESGLGNLTKIELEESLAGKTLELKAFIDEYSEGLSAKSSVKDFETLLQLTNLYFTAPRQDENAFAVLMNSSRTALLNRDNDPDLQFSDTLQMLQNDYSPRVPIFNLEMLDRVKLNRAFEIYKERFAEPADFTFVFAGNIHPEDGKVKELILTYLGGLKSKKRKEKYIDRSVRIPTGRVSKTIERKMTCPKASTEILFSSNTAYNLKNYVLMDALQEILTLRYDESIREKMQAGSKLTVKTVLSKIPVEQAVLSVSVVSDVARQQRLSKIVESELYKLIAYGIADYDLQKVKNSLLKNYEEKLNDNSWWLEHLAGHYENRIAFAADYKSALLALNDEQIRSALKKLVMSGNKIELFLRPSLN